MPPTGPSAPPSPRPDLNTDGRNRARTPAYQEEHEVKHIMTPPEGGNGVIRPSLSPPDGRFGIVVPVDGPVLPASIGLLPLTSSLSFRAQLLKMVKNASSPELLGIVHDFLQVRKPLSSGSGRPRRAIHQRKALMPDLEAII